MIANLKCPVCNNIEKKEIPKDACMPFYICSNCKNIIKAKEKCCVFCEYGDKKCQIAK